MYIPYEKIGQTIKLFFPKYSKDICEFCYDKKVEQNCSYTEKNSKIVLKKLRKVYGKRPIRVAFSCDDATKWKCHSLYDLFLESEYFHPFIIVTKNNTTYKDFIIPKNTEKAYEFFTKKGLETYLGCNLETDEIYPIENFKPDIIFYQEPWANKTIQGPVVASKFALTYYVPYFVPNAASSIEYGLRFHQYIHKYYVLNQLIKDFYAPKMQNEGKNLKIVGHTQLDYFYLNNHKTEDKKYVIYAPHWSIDEPRENYATFLWNGQFILDFAKKHPEIQWIFKPHPSLKLRLKVKKIMTDEEIETYWNEWNKISLVYESGDYLDLFSRSYAMITDCGSFLTEFLMTEQPVIHPVSETCAGYNPGTEKIVKSYYQAHNLEELEKYLEEIILKKNDPRKNERLAVIDELGLKNNYCAKNILEDIIGELSA